MEDNKIIFVVVFALIGVFITFFGKRFIKVTLFLAGFLLVFFAVMAFVFGYFVKNDTSSIAKWIIVGAAVVLGILMGIAVSRETAQKIGMFILGALLGVVVGAILY